MPSRLLSALQRHPKLSRPRRRAAAAAQASAAEAQPVDAAPDSVESTSCAPAARKPRRTRTPTCLTVDRRFRYTDYPKGETVPPLRMSGRWLEERGFSIGGNVYVEVGGAD